MNARSPALSADGRFIVFDGVMFGNSSQEVFIRDRQTGETERVPYPTGLNRQAYSASISADGNIVAFICDAYGIGITKRVCIHNRQTGQIRMVTPPPNSGRAVNTRRPYRSSNPVISPDGRFVSFSSDANGMVVGDFDDSEDHFIYELPPW